MFRAPSFAGLPPIDVMLRDLPATTEQIAQHLGLKSSTIASYLRTGEAPRAVMLAVFWETRWGRSAADTEAANWAAMQYRETQLYKREIERMAGVIERLEAEIARGAGQRSANLPIFHVR